MKNLTIKCYVLIRTSKCTKNVLYTNLFRRNCAINFAYENVQKKIHPYKQLHPWNSLQEFSEHLMNNIIYNKDGLVALNKPYGIALHKKPALRSNYHFLPNSKEYGLSDALPYIAKQLNYSTLSVISKPEKYMTGITLLVQDESIYQAVRRAVSRADHFENTFWVVTIQVPKQLKGKEQLAIKCEDNKVNLLSSWTRNQVESHKVKLLNIEYEVLANATHNLSSLVAIRASTLRKHAIRAFASTILYSPILGDNIFASQIQKVGKTYLRHGDIIINDPPILDKNLLSLLRVLPSEQKIIPVHIHLRSKVLPSYLRKNLDLMIEAPLIPPIHWTWNQLKAIK